MGKSCKEHIDQFLIWWVDRVRRVAVWVIVFTAIFSGIALYYTIGHLTIDASTADMLSPTLPFRRNLREFKHAFPQFKNTMLIVINARTPELAQDAADELADYLRKEPAIFKTVYMPGGGKFFERHGLLYLSPKKLEDLADNLAKIQPFLGELTRDQNLRGLFSMLTDAVKAVIDGENIDLSPLFHQISMAIEAVLNHRQYQVSWQELMHGGSVDPDRLRRFIIVQPQVNYSHLLPGKAAIREIRRLIRQLHLTSDYGIDVHLTGDIALKYDQWQSVRRGAKLASIVSTLLVAGILFAGLGSLWLVFISLLVLTIGLIWTAGFASIAVGHLNLISVTFAVLYIGLGVDYAIHFCLHYKELIQGGSDRPEALRRTTGDIGTSLLLCAFTTALGFYAFVPTAFAGMSELGIISGTGMFINLFITFTVLPPMLSLAPLSFRKRGIKTLSYCTRSFSSLSSRYARGISIGTLILAIGTLFLLPRVSFDRNTLDLRDPNSESVITLKQLLANSKTSPWHLNVLAPDLKTARAYATSLEKLDLVYKCITIENFIPSHQAEKLGTIADIALLIGPELLKTAHSPPPGLPEQMSAIHNFSLSLETYLKTANDSPLAHAASTLYTDLMHLDAALNVQGQKRYMLQDLDRSLLSSLPSQLRLLQASLEADRITQNNLPKDLVSRWISRDGRYRVEILPKENLLDKAALRRFVVAVHSVVPNAIGPPVVDLQAGDAVVKAFQQASILSLLAITVLLLILMRPRSDTILVLLPLLLAGGFTAAASVLFDIPFNFANVIALPLLLGVGVDNGIHIVHRARVMPLSVSQILHTSTAQAVVYSALTTICSFGSLGLSTHRGIRSMGELLTIGISFTLICTLVVLPALLKSRQEASMKGIEQ